MSDTTFQRLDVLKTYKLYVGGKFPRSESGRVYEVTDAKGEWLANVPLGTRKDARDAVVAARKAVKGWSGTTAYNRGQVLYRVAEMLQGRREQFAAEVAVSEGIGPKKAAALVDAAIDRWVWYAGWTDKVAQIAGGANPVAGPFFNLSTPEPTGVVGIVAPQAGYGHSLLGLVSVIAPAIATGNTVVVAAAATPRCPRCRWARCWPPRTSRAAWSTSSRAGRRTSPPPWPRTRTSTRWTSPGPSPSTVPARRSRWKRPPRIP